MSGFTPVVGRTNTKLEKRRYERFSARTALSAIPNFVFCLGPGCDSGQIHEAEHGDPYGSFMECVSCGFRQCVDHACSWHQNETCQLYDQRIHDQKQKAQRDQETASAKKVGKIAKICPGAHCGRKIEKVGGCNTIHCVCGKDFCWGCLGNCGSAYCLFYDNHGKKRKKPLPPYR